MTLGPGILALGLLEKKKPKLFKPVLVFGREPLCCYLLHMMMIGVFIWLNVLLVLIMHKGQIPQSDFLHHGLPIVYLGWLFVVSSLYFIFVILKKSKLK